MEMFGGLLADQIDVLNNIASTLRPIQRFLTGAAYLIGLALAFKAIYTLKVYGEARTMMASNSSIKEPVTYMLVAGILIYLPTGFQVIMNTTFGYSSVLAYGPTTGGESGFLEANAFGRPLVAIIQVVGLVAFIRGWVLIARSASQGQPPGGTGKGFMHVFGGVLAINIVGTMQVINNTLFGTG